MAEAWTTILEPESVGSRPRPRRGDRGGSGRSDPQWEAALRRALTGGDGRESDPPLATARQLEPAGMFHRTGRGHDPDLIMGRPDVVQPPRL